MDGRRVGFITGGKLSPQDRSSRLIIISAPSGAGKTTLCNKILQSFPNVTLSISTTTRTQRPGEKEGQYFFVTREKFQKKIEQGEFAEWAIVHGNYYGTSKAVIEKATQDSKHVLFDIDVQGAMSLKRTFGERTILIFVHPPSLSELKTRLQNRKQDTPESIKTRLKNAQKELKWSPDFDYEIVNDNLENAFQRVKKIIEQECR